MALMQLAPKAAILCEITQIGPFNVSDFGADRKPICNFLLVNKCMMSSRSEAFASDWLQSAVTTTHVLSMCHAVMLHTFFIVECGIACFLCAVHVFDTLASSSPLGYPCAKFRLCGDLRC